MAGQCLNTVQDIEKHCGDTHFSHHTHHIKPELTSTLENEDFLSKPIDNSDVKREYPKCYLPNDQEPLMSDIPQQMGPIGPWATGRVDWSPLAGLTGTRPVVDRYSITRYSINEWKERNREVLSNCQQSVHKSLKCENDSKNSLVRTFALADQVQNDSTKKLVARSKLVEKWKNTIERAINAMADEISTLEEQRQRLKQSLAVLRMPEAISTECLERRCGRSDTEQIRDIPEEEIIREIALISEIRDTLLRTLHDIEQQQIENRTARQRLEYDWSDKTITLNLEQTNCELNNRSTTILFKPGATRYAAEQSSEEYWEHFSKETLEVCEATRQKSITLRGTLDAILINAARDLRSQADKVEQALSNRIGCMEEMKVRLENDLTATLRCLADTETVIDKLNRGLKSMDYPMKVAQTRLDNRNQRPHVENCRDTTHTGLIDEVHIIQEGVSNLISALHDAETTKSTLIDTRYKLEQEILYKRRSIMIDRDRCQLLRSHFPSASALSGH